MSEALVVEAAKSQLGLITAAQAYALGLTRQMIRGRVERGAWIRLRPGVFVVGGAPPSWEQRVLAMCLTAGDDVVASHRSALRIWDLVHADGRPELQVQGVRRVRVPGATVHQSILLPDIDRTVRRGLPVTTLARTLVDGSAKQPPKTVEKWIDEAIRHERLDLRDLRSCIARLEGPGRRNLRSIKDALAPRLPGYDPGDSTLEATVLRALVRAGLPLPSQQHRVVRPDGTNAFIDLAYPAVMIAIEADSWTFHGQRGAFDNDRLRNNDAVLLGWRVFHFTSAMDPDAFAVVIATAFAQATQAA